MKIGFLNNQIDNRGTGNAIFDYAHYNEELLGNKSTILTINQDAPDLAMHTRLLQRFGRIYTIWDLVDGWTKVDYIYHIKSGEHDGTMIGGIPYGVHAVFNASQPHGDRYATISEWMGKRFDVPFVPHIVQIGPKADFRYKYKVPMEAKLIGRHGGPDTFDIHWVWDAINEVLKADPLVYFMFMNTDRPGVVFHDPTRVIFITGTANPYIKSAFVHACDAMLHARSRGETFGISVGEFALAGKIVFTYGDSGERAHIEQLGNLGYLYYDKKELVNGLLNFSPNTSFRSHYDDFTPYQVMAKFEEVFLNGI